MWLTVEWFNGGVFIFRIITRLCSDGLSQGNFSCVIIAPCGFYYQAYCAHPTPFIFLFIATFGCIAAIFCPICIVKKKAYLQNIIQYLSTCYLPRRRIEIPFIIDKESFISRKITYFESSHCEIGRASCRERV